MSSRHPITVVFVLAGILLIAGCVATGLSPREVRGQDFSTYALSLYDLPGTGNAAAPRPLRLPAKVAVAQVGEVAPPLAVLEILRKHPGLFDSVDPVPGVMDVGAQIAYSPNASDYQVQARRAASAHIDRMRRYASDLGAEYLFMFGGTIDQATTSTPLSAADLTIVGGFFVPSKRIQGMARATGALVDLQTGRVVLSVSADSKRKSVAPSFSRENGEVNMLIRLRDEVAADLAEELAASVKSHAAVGG